MSFEFDEEVEKYYKRLCKYRVLTRKEEYELFDSYKKSKCSKIKDKIALHNLRLVFKLALQLNKFGKHNLSLLDVMHYGVEGLMYAIELFNHKRGRKFSTYAVWHIRQRIGREAQRNELDIIRMPFDLRTKLIQYNKLVGEFAIRGYEVTDEQAIVALGVPAATLKRIKAAYSLSIAYIAEDRVLEFFGHTRLDDHDRNIFNEHLRDEVKNVLSSQAFNDKERYLVDQLYGLSGDRKTQAQVATEWGVSRQRVEQIHREIMRKLSHKRSLRYFAKELD